MVTTHMVACYHICPGRGFPDVHAMEKVIQVLCTLMVHMSKVGSEIDVFEAQIGGDTPLREKCLSQLNGR